MKPIFLFWLCSFFLQGNAQTEQSLINEANNLEASMNETGAFEKIRQALYINPNNYYACWKASELCSRIGSRQLNKDAETKVFLTGKQYAERAIRINPKGADGYYALSVAMGKLALPSLPAKERISAVKAIKYNAEKAIRLDPQHGRAWHVLGKWHYEISNLNVFERAGVKIYLADYLSASIEQSIYAYEKARQLQPDFALNDLELAKAYKQNNQHQKAIAVLQKLLSVSNRTSDDNRIKTEGRKLLKELLD